MVSVREADLGCPVCTGSVRSVSSERRDLKCLRCIRSMTSVREADPRRLLCIVSLPKELMSKFIYLKRAEEGNIAVITTHIC